MKEPFVNLVDVAGILMICLFICIVLALLGSKLITWGVVLVIGVLFAGAIFFAKKGAVSQRPPEFFQPTRASAWIGFGLFFAVLAFFFPWLLGFLAGGLIFYAFFYFFYRMLGGK